VVCPKSMGMLLVKKKTAAKAANLFIRRPPGDNRHLQ
jgi:hypothetical protein